jgi:lysophospholipase L1-like esterase
VTFWMVAAALAAALLVVAEAGTRWWFRRRSGYYVWPPGLRLKMQLDPEVLPELEPWVRFEVNTDGERGRDVRGSEVGLYRILVGGGSPVECLALDQSTSWPGALERLLGAPDTLQALGARRVHVGSIGRSGVASADLDLILERVLPRYRRLSAIVLMVGAGDVFRWLEQGTPPGVPPPPLSAAQLFSCHPEQPFSWRPREWALVEAARRLRQSWLHRWEVRERGGGWYAQARQMRAQAQELRTTVPDPTVMVDHFEHHFRRLIRTARGHADRVLVVRQPWFEKDYTAEEAAHFWHGGVGKAWKQTITVYYSLEVINRLMHLIDARAAKVLEELGVEHLDLRPMLTPSLRNYYDFVHYTPAGAAVVAQAVATALLERPASTGRPLHVGGAVSVSAASQRVGHPYNVSAQPEPPTSAPGNGRHRAPRRY